MRTLTVLAVSLFLQAPESAAQVTEGTRVRVKTAEGTEVGTVATLDRERLTLAPDKRGALGAPRTIAVEDIEKLEVFIGRSSKRGRKARVGAVVGLAYMGVVCAAERNCDDPLTPAGFVFSGLLGAGVGSLVGLVPTDTWQPVPRERLRVTVAPVRGGGVGVALSWPSKRMP